MNNFKDNYYRTNPRRNAKCSPMLWGDNHKYYFNRNIEGFANISNKQIVNNNKINNKVNNNKVNNNKKNGNNLVNWNDNNSDNYEYVEPNVSLKCGGGKALISQHIGHDMTNLNMYDIDAKSLMKKQVLGDIKEIDAIHNNIDNNHMNFHKIQVMTMRNSMERSHYGMNEKVLQGKERSFLDDDFFRGDFNRDYFVPPTRIDRSKKSNFEKKWNREMGN
jgi:hypothetical protein